jgi:hypothetical protein
MNKLFSSISNVTKVILAIMVMQSSHVLSDIIFQDDFESGAFSGMWGSATSVNIVDDTVSGGNATKVADFFFRGKESGKDSFAELRFDLATTHPELSIKFDMYIPANYNHRDERPSNNKFFRLWPEDYTDKEKIGSSFKPESDGVSGLGPDYSLSASSPISTNVGGATPNFIGKADNGKWMSIIIDVLASNGSQEGFIKITKNGVVFFSAKFNNDYNSSTLGYRHGYLLGWANSGHDVDTHIYIDNVEFHDKVSITPRKPDNIIVN